MKKNVKKSKPLLGEIIIPADKSISHRAIMLSSLAEGKSLIKNFSKGADCRTTLNVFKQLGVNIEEIDQNTIEVISKGKLIESESPLYAGNSGTTMRIMSGILSGQNFDSVLTGDESLSKRPMRRVIEPLMQMGAKIYSDNGRAPLKVYGSNLHGIIYKMPIASAQVKSAILLAGLNADTKTVIIEQAQSRNHTEILLKYLGAEILTNRNEIVINPSRLTAKNIEVVGDISSAAFFIVAGLIVPGSDFVVKGVGINSTRTGVLDVIKRMNGGDNIEIINRKLVSGEDCADIRVKYAENLYGCVIGGADIPRLIDELPIIAVLASQAEGDTVVKNAEDLRNKESDRIKCLVSELSKIGVNIEETRDGFVVHGKNKLKGGVSIESYNDHRLAMSFYIAGMICNEEISINGLEWTKISFPEFETLINQLCDN